MRVDPPRFFIGANCDSPRDLRTRVHDARTRTRFPFRKFSFLFFFLSRKESEINVTRESTIVEKIASELEEFRVSRITRYHVLEDDTPSYAQKLRLTRQHRLISHRLITKVHFESR